MRELELLATLLLTLAGQTAPGRRTSARGGGGKVHLQRRSEEEREDNQIIHQESENVTKGVSHVYVVSRRGELSHELFASQVSRVNAQSGNCNPLCFLPLLHRVVSCGLRRVETPSWPFLYQLGNPEVAVGFGL